MNNKTVNTRIPVRSDDWAYLQRCAKAIEWLENQGVCWREADRVESDWTIPGSTEWAYGSHGCLLSRIEQHMTQLRK